MVNRNICLFLIPMPFCTFVVLCFWTFLSFLSPSACLLSDFFLILIQDPLSIVSFCVRYVLMFQLTDGEGLWQSCTHMVQYFVLIHIAFLGDFDSYFPFGFQFLAWDHLYIIYYLPCFLSMGLLLSPPRTFFFRCEMDGASKQYSRPFDPELFSKIKQEFNVFIATQENLLTRINSISSNKSTQSSTQGFQLIQNPDAFHATKSLPLLFKPKQK